MDEFLVRLKVDMPDVVGVTEVWMKESFCIEGYHPAIRYDRPEDKRGGGVLLFVHEKLEMVDCNALNSTQSVEAAWCYIKLRKSEKLLVGVCYQPPNSPEDSNKGMIEMLLRTRELGSSQTVVMGDFNFP